MTPPRENASPALRLPRDETVAVPVRDMQQGDIAGVQTSTEPLPPHRPLTPQTTPFGERLRRLFAIAVLLYGAWYLTWRWTATLNPDALWFAIPLALAETFAVVSTAFFVFNVWRIRHREPSPAPEGLSVDVFITTYNEPVSLIRKTALGARDIRYPHETWILDDGRRSEVRALAEELGVRYLTRPDNRNAKAGNLNHALAHTSGAFILQLDADHVPLPHILDRLLGYMRDDEVAFVQSPQNFYNLDDFTGHTNRKTGRYHAEQDIFFNVIEPGKDHWNAAFFCGSCAVLRRDAIERIGGFATETITEDFETSLRLHASGWKSVYHAEGLAYGLSTRTAEAFHVQRLRWAQGTMQVWRRQNPLTMRGLSLAQRIAYFYSVLVYLDGIPRLVFAMAPVVYLVAGVLPIANVGALSFLLHFAPLFIGAVLLNRVMGRGFSAPFWLLERNTLAKMFTHTLGITGYVTRRRLRFRVTGKAQGGVSPSNWRPHALLLAVTVGGLAYGSLAFVQGWVDYGDAGAAAVPFLLNVAWALWTVWITGAVIATTLRSKERRDDYRFPVQPMPAALRANGEAGADPCQGFGHLLDLSTNGACLDIGTPFRPGAAIRMALQLDKGPAILSGRVIRSQRRPGTTRRFEVAVSFDTPESAAVSRAAKRQQEARDRVALHTIHTVAPATQWSRQRPPGRPDTPVQPDRDGRAVHHRNERIQEEDTAMEPITIIPEHKTPRAGRLVAVTTAVLLLLAGFATQAAGQVHDGYLASAEAATNGQRAYLAGGWWSFGDGPWRPTVTLMGYRVELADASVALGAPDGLWAINPAAGLRYQGASGGVQATAGYTWLSDGDVSSLASVSQRVDEGLTTSAQADYYGSGDIGLQGIVSYSWSGNGYVWSRLRGVQHVGTLAERSIRLGAEVGGQGNDADYRAYDVGGVVEWANQPAVIVLNAGYRFVDLGSAESAPYVALSVVWMP